MQLAGASLAGVALYTLTLLLVLWILHPGMPWTGASASGWVKSLFRICTALAILVPGIVIKFRAMSLLREGVRQERWHEKELEALRQQVDRPVWTAATWLMFGLVVLGVLLLSLYPAFSSAWLFIWMPATLVGELRSALRKPDPLARKMIDWSTAKPLQSKHWGRS
jgi:hypothetical protein